MLSTVTMMTDTHRPDGPLLNWPLLVFRTGEYWHVYSVVHIVSLDLLPIEVGYLYSAKSSLDSQHMLARSAKRHLSGIERAS